MYEVEVKLRTAHDPVRGRLREHGTRQRTVHQRDTYYDAPDRDFAATDEALRIREVTGDGGTETRLTYKGPLVDAASKTREEHETAVADGEALAGALAGLGYTPVETVEKEREVWTVDGYTVVLDDVTGLGEFVEVETESDDIETAREGAFAVCHRLGLDPDEQVRTSYLSLLLTENAHE